MAPTIGPNEAPIIPKTLSRLPAHPVTAIMMLMIAPMPTERKGFTWGMTVLKLLAAMNDEKQAPGNEARVRPIMIVAKRPGESFFSRAAVMLTTEGSMIPVARAPATAMTEMPAVKIMAMMMPTIPPMLTSFLFRLLVQISTPAAPAVAKKPTMAPTISSMDFNPLPESPTAG